MIGKKLATFQPNYIVIVLTTMCDGQATSFLATGFSDSILNLFSYNKDNNEWQSLGHDVTPGGRSVNKVLLLDKDVVLFLPRTATLFKYRLNNTLYLYQKF